MRVDSVSGVGAARSVEEISSRLPAPGNQAREAQPRMVGATGSAADPAAQVDGNAHPATDGLGRTAKTKEKEADQKSVRKAVEDANRELTRRGTELNFQIDDKSGSLVVKLLDSSTKEVLRQMPTKEALKIAQALKDGNGAGGTLLRADA